MGVNNLINVSKNELMKAIIEKQVTILPANSGFVSKSDTGREPCIVIIKLFSIPIYRKEVIIPK